MKYILVPFILVLIAWLQEILDQLLFGGMWNLPMGSGLPWWGLITAPFSHSGFPHLFSNTIVFLPLSIFVLSRGLRDYIAIWLFVLFLEIPMVIFWPKISHGLSGVVYGMLGYLSFIGFLEKRPISILLSVICICLYGNSLVALIPIFSPVGVSWIGHLSGFVGGFLAALATFKETRKS